MKTPQRRGFGAHFAAIVNDPVLLLAAILNMNTLWLVYQGLGVEYLVVGMSVSAVISLRLSAAAFNTICAPYSMAMTNYLDERLQKSVVPTSEFRQHAIAWFTSRWRWYWHALIISLAAQFPVQALAYPLAIYWFGEAQWEDVLVLRANEPWWAIFGKSWPIAIYFSPTIGWAFDLCEQYIWRPVASVAVWRILFPPIRFIRFMLRRPRSQMDAQ